MAKYKVEQFSHVIKDNLYLSLTLQNSAGNPAKRNYQIVPDTRWPDLAALTNTIVAGLTLAQQTGVSIELSDFVERFYLFLVLPSSSGKVNMQVTAKKL